MEHKIIKKTIWYLFTVVFFGIFYYFLPFAGDDWAWGSQTGINRLNNAFSGYNGRYLGNILIILITRSVVAKLVLCSLTMFLLVFILCKIFDGLSKEKNGTVNYILAFSSVLVLVVPNQIAFGELQPFQIFGSTVGWLSGFTNYAVPSVLILIFYYFAANKGFENIWVYIFLVFDGIVACLCVEHYSLFCMLFSFAVVAYRFYHYKRICKKSLFFFSGSFVGSLIMFSNSSYRLMQKGDVNENQRAVGFLGSFKQYAKYIFGENANETLVAVFTAVLLLSIAAFLIFFFIKSYKAFKSRNIINLLPMICLVVMTLPLLVTNSGKEIYVVAPRCYFLQYFMLVIYFFKKFSDKNKAGRISFDKKAVTGLKLCLAALIVLTGILYFNLDYTGYIRNKTVDTALDNDYSTIEIIEYPKGIEHIQWSSNFITKETYLERYRNFKNIPKDKELVLVSSE